MSFIYLCLDTDDIVSGIAVLEYEMIHPERIPQTIADYTKVGMKYNRVDGTFSEIPVVESNIVTRLQFRQKFNLTELSSIYAAKSTDVLLNIFLDDLAVADHVDFNNTTTQMGMGYLVNQGYITYERMLEIMG